MSHLNGSKPNATTRAVNQYLLSRLDLSQLLECVINRQENAGDSRGLGKCHPLRNSSDRVLIRQYIIGKAGRTKSSNTITGSKTFDSFPYWSRHLQFPDPVSGRPAHSHCFVGEQPKRVHHITEIQPGHFDVHQLDPLVGAPRDMPSSERFRNCPGKSKPKRTTCLVLSSTATAPLEAIDSGHIPSPITPDDDFTLSIRRN